MIPIQHYEEDDPFRIPNLDTVLYSQYSDAMDEFKRALSDQAVNAIKKKVCH